MGSPTLDETIALANKSAEQAAAYLDDPPELIFLQEGPSFKDHLINIAQELNLDSEPSDLSVIELLDTILALVPDNMRAFGTAATMYLRAGFVNPGTTLSAIGHLNMAKYIRLISEVTGGDPGLLSNIVTWEDRARSENPAERGSYSLAKTLGAKTFGPAQINIDTAIDMLTKYPKLFELDDGGELEGKIDGMRPDGNFLRDEVGYHLFYSYDFAAAVAGVYVMHINDRLRADMRDYTVEITDTHTEDPRSISRHQLHKMTAIGYNQGLGGAIAKLKVRFVGGGVASLREIIQRVSYTYTSDHFQNPSSLMGLQSTLKDHLEGLGMKESGAGTDPSLSISEGELQLLTIAAHFEGLNNILEEFKRSGAANVLAGVQNTFKHNDYEDNVLGMQGTARALYGLSYEGDPNGT